MNTFRVEVYATTTVQTALDVKADNAEEAEAIAIIRAGKLPNAAWSVRDAVLPDTIALTGEYAMERGKK